MVDFEGAILKHKGGEKIPLPAAKSHLLVTGRATSFITE
jgi:hypothetical protein